MADQMPMPDAGPAAPPEKPGFFSTALGKVVIIGGALGALLVVIGIVAAIVVFFVFNKAADEISTQVQQTGTAVKTAAASKVASAAAEAATEPTSVVIPVTNADVFVARDPFAPVIEPTETVDASDVDTSNVTYEKNTIVLHQIISSDGEYKAVLSWNGTVYTAGEGEQLGSTPWKVISVSEDSAVLLFGDVRVTLTVGEGVSK